MGYLATNEIYYLGNILSQIYVVTIVLLGRGAAGSASANWFSVRETVGMADL
jgi:hypothetical protein